MPGVTLEPAHCLRPFGLAQQFAFRCRSRPRSPVANTDFSSNKHHIMKHVFLALLAGALLAGCGDSSSIKQDELCTYTSDDEAKACKPGQLSYFQPTSWGNEQMPLNAAAAYCDFRHQVVHTNAGVLCIFTDKRLHLLQ